MEHRSTDSRSYKPTHGFTLIELLVVIAIIATLLSIIVPSLRLAKEKARRIMCLGHQRGLLQAMYVYAQNNEDKIPSNTAGNNALFGFFAWLNWTNPPSWQGLGRLYGGDYITEPDILYCPSQKNPLLRDVETENVGWQWTTPNGNESRAISYHYGLLGEIRAMRSLELQTMKLSELNWRVLICDVFLPFANEPVWAHPGGISAGFGDGHAEFKKIDQDVIDYSQTVTVYPFTRSIDDTDLFVAAMFELLRGKRHVLDTKFLNP